MPYRVRRPYVIVNGQRLVSPGAGPQRLPFCDRCNELAATHASVYTEIALDRWWKWVAFPRFSRQPEALMGCEKHPVQSEIRFLDGRVEAFTRIPSARWRRLTDRDVVWAAIFGLVFAIIFALLHL
jgi:hypothetical protein